MLPLRTEFIQMAGTAVQLSSTKIVRILLTTIDTAFLGHLGTQQLAAVALSAQWQGVPSTAVQFTIQAVTTLSSQARGAGNDKLVGEWLQTALMVALLGSLPVMAVFYNVHRMVAITMSDPATVEYARQFSQIMAWSLPPQYLYVALTSWFACVGVVMPATFATCVTVAANALFNWIFIYGYGPFPALGFIGSPLATVASSYLQLLIFVMCVASPASHRGAWTLLRPMQDATTTEHCAPCARRYTVLIKGYHRPYWGGWTGRALGSDRLGTFLALGIPTALSSVVDWASGAVAGSFAGLCGVTVAAGQNVMNGAETRLRQRAKGQSALLGLLPCRPPPSSPPCRPPSSSLPRRPPPSSCHVARPHHPCHVAPHDALAPPPRRRHPSVPPPPSLPARFRPSEHVSVARAHGYALC